MGLDKCIITHIQHYEIIQRIFIVLKVFCAPPTHLPNCPPTPAGPNFFSFSLCVRAVASVMSNSLRPYGPWPAKLLCPWDSPGKNTGVGCHFLLLILSVALPFFRMSYSWNHTAVAFLDWLLSLSNVHLSFLHVLLWLDNSFLLSTRNLRINCIISKSCL